MNAHLRPSDPQLQLSILFLTLAETQRTETRSRVPELEQQREKQPILPVIFEEPERWDGGW